MYDNEYKLYTSKQWGMDISEVSPDVFKRVPVYLNDKDVYQSSKYQFVPKGGFTEWSRRMLDSSNIDVELNVDAIANKVISVKDNKVLINRNDVKENALVLFTGQIDELFNFEFGTLPYRSLEFIWKTIEKDEYQPTEVVAYPQADKITRVTEYKKLPPQHIKGKTVIAIEIPFPYGKSLPVGSEPYYPIKNDTNELLYSKYQEIANTIDNLYLCGRLADYKYYNMDMTIDRAWSVADQMLKKLKN